MPLLKISKMENLSSNGTTKSVSNKYTINQLDLELWDTFNNDVKTSIEQIPDINLVEGFNIPTALQCNSESNVEHQADGFIFEALKQFIKTLNRTKTNNVELNEVSIIGRDGSCLGNPDRILVTDGYKYSKMCIEFKTPWALNSDNIILSYKKECETYKNKKNKGKVTRAIEQIFFYMTINRHRYGCLTTFDKTWFFKKMESPGSPGKSKVFVSPVILCSSKTPYTLLSAWSFIIMEIEKDSNWMYSSPHSSQVTTPIIKRKNTLRKNKKNTSIYTEIDLDGLLHWENILCRGNYSAVATGTFNGTHNVIFKTIDISKKKDGKALLDNEVKIYKHLSSLQGSVIPNFLAYGNIGGLLQVIVLENVGKRLKTK